MLTWEGIESIDEYKHFGFVYLIEYTNGKKYIGRKNLYTVKNQLAKQNGTKRANHFRFYGKNVKGKRVTYEECRTPSNWKTYNGSSKLTKGFQIARKSIIKVCDTPLDLTYYETYYLMVNNVLFSDVYMNQCVGRHFFAGRITDTKKYIKE